MKNTPIAVMFSAVFSLPTVALWEHGKYGLAGVFVALYTLLAIGLSFEENKKRTENK